MAGINPSVSRLAALFLAIVAVAAVVGTLIVPMMMTARLEHRTDDIETNIAMLQAMLVKRENMLAEQRLLRRSTETANAAIVAETPALAGAALQSWARDMVEAIGAEVNSTQIQEPVQGDTFAEVRVNMRLRASIKQLQGILHEMESHTPVMIVRGAAISRAGNALDADITQPLATRLSISGYTRIADSQN